MALDTTKQRLQRHTLERMPPSIRVQALAALYIGEQIAQLTSVIYSAMNPTDADLNKKLDQALQVAEAILAKEVESTKTGASCPRCLSYDVVPVDNMTAVWICKDCGYQGRPSAFYRKPGS